MSNNLSNSCKKIGLLDIYMDKIKILLPNSKNENALEVLNKIAYNMKNLNTIGYNPTIDVNYKIEFINHFDNNLILIDEGDNPFLMILLINYLYRFIEKVFTMIMSFLMVLRFVIN